MARKSRASDPDTVVKRLREAHAQLRLQSDRASRAADSLGELIIQLEAELRAPETPQATARRTTS